MFSYHLYKLYERCILLILFLKCERKGGREVREEKEGRREISIQWFIPQLHATVEVGLGWCMVSELPPRLPRRWQEAGGRHSSQEWDPSTVMRNSGQLMSSPDPPNLSLLSIVPSSPLIRTRSCRRTQGPGPGEPEPTRTPTPGACGPGTYCAGGPKDTTRDRWSWPTTGS